MPSLILYLTSADVDDLRDWINADPRLAWIVPQAAGEREASWRAFERVDALGDQRYAIWNSDDDRLGVPVAAGGTRLVDPFIGWTAPQPDPTATAPWFGDALPGPYILAVRRSSREHAEGIGRSDLSWHANRFAGIGKPATSRAVAGWRRLVRFVKRSAVALPWPINAPPSRFKAFAFPDAFREIERGRQVDENP